MCKEDNGLKNTAIIDIDRYNFLLNKEKAFNEYFNDDDVALIIEKDRWKDDEYRVISINATVKEIGGIHNKFVNNSVSERLYNELEKRCDELEDVAIKRKEYIDELKKQIELIKNLSTKEFKKWKKGEL